VGQERGRSLRGEPRLRCRAAALDVAFSQIALEEAVEHPAGQLGGGAKLDDLDRLAAGPSDGLDDLRALRRVRDDGRELSQRRVAREGAAQIAVQPLLIPCAG
jgi:hypothetical protein